MSKKKHQKDYFENYAAKYKSGCVGGIFFALIYFVIYLIYRFWQWLV